jgi:hypothetical protein
MALILAISKSDRSILTASLILALPRQLSIDGVETAEMMAIMAITTINSYMVKPNLLRINVLLTERSAIIMPADFILQLSLSAHMDNNLSFSSN